MALIIRERISLVHLAANINSVLIAGLIDGKKNRGSDVFRSGGRGYGRRRWDMGAGGCGRAFSEVHGVA